MNATKFKKGVEPIFDQIKGTNDACLLFFQSGDPEEPSPNGHMQANMDARDAMAVIFLLIRQYQLTEMPVKELFGLAQEVKEGVDEITVTDDTWHDVIEAFGGNDV